MSISARMHFFPPFAGHASFRELSKLWQEVFFKLDLGWLAGALLSTLIKLPAVYRSRALKNRGSYGNSTLFSKGHST